MNTICSVFKVDQKAITDIRTLKEGMTNDSFIFTVNGNQYVFRSPGNGTELLINRTQEASVYDALIGSGISDEVIYLNPENGYKISKYIINARNLDPNNNLEVSQGINLIRELHSLDLKVSHDFNIFERIEEYLNYCNEANAILFSDFDEVSKLINQVKDVLSIISRPKVLAHVDSVPVNFMLSDKSIQLIDWEYSGMGDPLIDLAMFVVYSGYSEERSIELLREYLGRKETEDELIVLFSYIALAGYLWSLWTQLKQAEGQDFGTYGIEQYQYARSYARKVIKLTQNS